MQFRSALILTFAAVAIAAPVSVDTSASNEIDNTFDDRQGNPSPMPAQWPWGDGWWPFNSTSYGSNSCGQGPLAFGAEQTPLRVDCETAKNQFLGFATMLSCGYGRQTHVSGSCVVAWHPGPDCPSDAKLPAPQVEASLDELIDACQTGMNADAIMNYAYHSIDTASAGTDWGSVSIYSVTSEPDA